VDIKPQSISLFSALQAAARFKNSVKFIPEVFILGTLPQ
jgi:hypothetical protein